MSDPLQGEGTGELRGIFLFEPVTSFEDDAAKYRRELFYDNYWAVRVTKPERLIITDVS